MFINDPSVMTHDEQGLGIAWNPRTEQWFWSNPDVANSAGTLVSDVTFDGVAQNAATVFGITNPSALDWISDDVTLRGGSPHRGLGLEHAVERR